MIYSLMNAFTGVKVLALIREFFPTFRALVFWPLFIVFCYSFILLYLLRLERIQALRQTLIYTLPLMMYFFMSLLIMDAVMLAVRLFGKLTFPYTVGTGIALALTIILMIYAHFHAKDIKTVCYSINLGKEAGPPLRAALIADLHIGGNTDRKWLANIVDAVIRTEPDIIFIAGDIFETDMANMLDQQGKTAELKRLSAPLGVYAVPGNHDVDSHSIRGSASTELIKEFLENTGIVFLQDEVRLIDQRFYLAGRRDIRPIGGGLQRKTALELVEGLDKSKPIFFMDHQPLDFRRIEEAGADLIFSGHTHRGQFFPGNIATYFIFKRAGASNYGHWKGGSAQGIITSGTSLWGPVLRLGTNSEVVVADIVFNSSGPHE